MVLKSRGFPPPVHAAIVAADQEPEARGVPPAIVIHRVGLAVDDVHQRLGQTPLAAGLHRRQDLLQVGQVARRAPARAEHAGRGLQVQFPRGQRAAVLGIDH